MAVPIDLDTLPWEEQVRIRREVWEQKPLLREIYESWFDLIKNHVPTGKRILEAGGGSGFFKRHWPELISGDIVHAPWLDFQADCLALPFANSTFEACVGLDIIHHLYDPDKALRELARVTKPGGLGVFAEPFVSPFSGAVRAKFHQEKQDMTQESLYDENKNPDDSNLAISTLIFHTHRRKFAERFPEWEIIKVKRFEKMTYALTGGFSRPYLLPECILRAMRTLGRLAEPLAPLFAFKMLIVLKRTNLTV